MSITCPIPWSAAGSPGSIATRTAIPWGGEAGYYMLKRDDEALHIHVYVPRLAE